MRYELRFTACEVMSETHAVLTITGREDGEVTYSRTFEDDWETEDLRPWSIYKWATDVLIRATHGL